jgi:hypothetical protein
VLLLFYRLLSSFGFFGLVAQSPFLHPFQQHTSGFIIGVLWDEFTAKGFGEEGWGEPIGL